MQAPSTGCAAMFKDLLVPLSGNPADADAIHAALDLAVHFEAHLALLEIVALPLPAASPWGLSPHGLAAGSGSATISSSARCASKCAAMSRAACMASASAGLPESGTSRSLNMAAQPVGGACIASHPRRAGIDLRQRRVA